MAKCWTILSLVILTILLSNCSASQRAQRHLSKAIDHIEKAKKLDPSISLKRIDTVTVEKIVPRVVTDTVVKVTPSDTVVIENERVKVKLIKVGGDTVYVQAEAKPDTLYIKVPCESEILIKKESYKDIVKRVVGVGNFGFYAIHTIIGLLGLAYIYLKLILPKWPNLKL